MRKLFFASLALAVAFVGSANAAVDYVTNNVIYGSGNSNGGFTIVQNASTGVELGLRTHLRYPTQSDNAAGIMSQGNGVYGNFATGNFGPGGVRGSWNFDWSINSNFNGSGTNLDTGLTYELDIDYDPTAGTNFLSIDPLNGSQYTNGLFTYADHSFGDNSTGPNAGVEAGNAIAYGGLLGASSLVQNSANLAFFVGPQAFDPNVSGNYVIKLSAFRGTDLVASTSIQVLVGDAVATPEAASIAVWGGLGACAMVLGYWRKKRAVKA